MTADQPRARAGITLTEILISLLIMAIGLISLATLFPLGLLRIRDANRNSRSTLLGKSGYGDMGVRNLLDKRSFYISWYNAASFPAYFDPFTQDPLWTNIGYGLRDQLLSANPPFPPYPPPVGPGLPICYDPLWRAKAQPNPQMTGFNQGIGTYPNATYEARFGSGVGFVRPTDPTDGGYPSVYGLQRISNFVPWTPANAYWPFVYASNAVPGAPDVAGATFASPDDIVWQTEGVKPLNVLPFATGVGNPVVPDLFTANGLASDWKYTWFFTGFQADVNDPSPDVFVGNIVVCENRQLAYDVAVSPFGGGVSVAGGETVVEAVFGAGNFLQTGTFYAVGGDNTILLRWPASMKDPDVRSGGWIADVTYERNAATALSRFANTTYPAQRCYWYRVVKHSDPAIDPTPNLPVPYRFMTVIIDSPVQAKTGAINGVPQINAALIMPSVINVFPKIIYVR